MSRALWAIEDHLEGDYAPGATRVAALLQRGRGSLALPASAQ